MAISIYGTQATFQKHATFRNLSYLPATMTAYTQTTSEGQRFAIFYPQGSPNDYELFRGDGAWTPIFYYQCSGFDTSDSTFSDASNVTLTTSQGWLWQALNLGFPIVFVQLSVAANAKSYTGRGFFNPPGITGAYFEALDRPTQWKDAVIASQNVMFNRRTYGFGPYFGVAGDSGGAIVAGMQAFAPPRSRELAAGGQFDVGTHPSFCVLDRLPGLTFIDAHSQSITTYGKPFPAAAGGNAVATDLSSVAGGGATGTLFKNAFSLMGMTPMVGKRCPSTLLHSSISPISANYYAPGPAATELNIHGAYDALSLRALVGARRNGQQGVKLPYSIALMLGSAVFTPPAWSSSHGAYAVGDVVSYLLPNVTYTCNTAHTAAAGKEPTNGSFWTGPNAVPTSEQYDGTLDALDTDGNAGNVTGTVVDFLTAHAHEEPVYTLKDREPWVWQSQCETGGRWIIGPYPRTRTLRITCIDATNSLTIQHFGQLTKGGVTLPPGTSAEIVTRDGVYAKAAASTSAFEIEEIVS